MDSRLRGNDGCGRGDASDSACFSAGEQCPVVVNIDGDAVKGAAVQLGGDGLSERRRMPPR